MAFQKRLKQIKYRDKERQTIAAKSALLLIDFRWLKFPVCFFLVGQTSISPPRRRLIRHENEGPHR